MGPLRGFATSRSGRQRRFVAVAVRSQSSAVHAAAFVVCGGRPALPVAAAEGEGKRVREGERERERENKSAQKIEDFVTE